MHISITTFNFDAHRYVAEKLKEVIEMCGPKNVMVVIIDGGTDWTATEVMIQQK